MLTAIIMKFQLFLISIGCGIALLSVHSFGEESPVPARAKRDADIELPLNISFTVNQDAGTCYGDTSAGLGNTNLILVGGDFSTAVNIPGSGCVVLRLVQEEHVGGDCNCWELTNPVPNFTYTNSTQ